MEKSKISVKEIKTKQIRSRMEGEAQISLETFLIEAGKKALQDALEEEVSDYLGRRWYERQDKEKEEFSGYRNGYQDYTLRTRAGRMEIRKPRVRGTNEPYRSRIAESLDTMFDDLKRMVLEGYVRGLSTRDIEETFVDQNGRALLSKSSASNLNKQFNEEYEQWRKRDLSEHDIVYLFVDGVYESIRRYTSNQAILCAWAICSNGEKVLLGLEAVRSESEESWSDFFETMIRRGLGQPLLIISDGSKGLIKAIAGSFPQSDRQRCLAHKLRNLMIKVPKHMHDEILNKAKMIYYAPDMDTAEILAKDFVNSYSAQMPSMVNCFIEDLASCLTHLKYPLIHRKYVRTTNLIERAFEEQKRRTKVLPQHENEQAALGLVFGVLIRTSRKWQRIKMTDFELSVLKNIKNFICPMDSNNSRLSFRRIA